jgi:trehalose 6-phosphate phosphatase
MPACFSIPANGVLNSGRATIYPVVSTSRPNDAPPTELLREASLFLDFDGTLVEIAERPDAVLVGERLSGVVDRLLDRLDGRVAVISGRPAAEITALLDKPVLVVGSHGLEFAGARGQLGSPSRPAGLADALEAMNELAAVRPGLMVEDKPFGAALHFRRLPAAEAECMRLASELARTHQLHLQPGKMMVEVRAGGGDKGTAIRALMREPEMADGRPVFMGDDLTDEPGFVAAAQIGGAGILVGERRESAARFRLSGVEAALAWLEAASAEAA